MEAILGSNKRFPAAVRRPERVHQTWSACIPSVTSRKFVIARLYEGAGRGGAGAGASVDVPAQISSLENQRLSKSHLQCSDDRRGFIGLLGEAALELAPVSTYPLGPFLGSLATLLADQVVQGFSDGQVSMREKSGAVHFPEESPREDLITQLGNARWRRC